MRERADLGREQARLAVALELVLVDGVSVVPAGARRLALELEGEYRQAVEEDDEVDALAFLVVDLLHHREDVGVEALAGHAVERGGGARVDEGELDAGVERDALPDDLDQAARTYLVGDSAEDGLARAPVVDGVQALQRLALRRLEELEEKVGVHGLHRVVVPRGVAAAVAVVLHEMGDDELLEGAFDEGVLPHVPRAVHHEAGAPDLGRAEQPVAPDRALVGLLADIACLEETSLVLALHAIPPRPRGACR